MKNAKPTMDPVQQGARLKQARIKRGFTSGKAACEYFGWNYNTYAQHENGRSGLNSKSAPRYADAYGVSPGWLLSGETEAQQVPMLASSGKVSAGIWLEADIDFAEHSTGGELYPADPRFPRDHQFILEVEGTSINRVARDGDHLVCLSVLHAAPRLNDHDLVVVRRTRFGGQLLEFTAKRLRIPADNAPWELWPDSTDDGHQNRILLATEDEHDTVEIIGKVLWIQRKP